MSAILIARDGPKARAVEKALAARGIVAHTARPDDRDPFAKIALDPRISLLVVHAPEVGGAVRDRLRRIVYAQPRLNVVVTGADAELERALRELGVAEFHGFGASADVLAGAAAAALSRHDYDAAVVDALRASMLGLAESASINLAANPPLVRVNAAVIGEISAIIEISGDLSARLITAGPPGFFERLSRGWLGRPARTKDHVWDAAGELCNRLAGSVRDHYAGRGLTSQQSMPTVIEGSGVSIRCLTDRPGLVIPFEARRSVGLVATELIIARKAADREPGAERMARDELTFL